MSDNNSKKIKQTTRVIALSIRKDSISGKKGVYIWLQGKTNGTAELPGGKIDENEPPEIAAKREFLEETTGQINSDQVEVVDYLGEILYINNYNRRNDPTSVKYYILKVSPDLELDHRKALAEDNLLEGCLLPVELFTRLVKNQIIDSEADAISGDRIKLYWPRSIFGFVLSQNSGRLTLEMLKKIESYAQEMLNEIKSETELRQLKYLKQNFPEFLKRRFSGERKFTENADRIILEISRKNRNAEILPPKNSERIGFGKIF